MPSKRSDDKVLFVDDELLVLQSIRRILRNKEFETYYANNAKEALELLKSVEIAVLVTDLKMPVMSGLELLKVVQEKYPNIIRVVLTGYYQVSTILSAINTGHIHRYITKPWKKDEEFMPTIRQAIEYYHSKIEKKKQVEELIYQNENLKMKAYEILKMKRAIDSSDRNKSKILNYLAQEIIPYMAKTNKILDDIEANNIDTLKNSVGNLNLKGVRILRLLRKIEALIKSQCIF